MFTPRTLTILSSGITSFNKYLYANVYKIFAGDFNTILDPTLDRKSEVGTYRKYREALTSWMEEEDLIDIWRVQVGYLKRYTWRGRVRSMNDRVTTF
jgi:hypothetical protein